MAPNVPRDQKRLLHIILKEARVETDIKSIHTVASKLHTIAGIFRYWLFANTFNSGQKCLSRVACLWSKNASERKSRNLSHQLQKNELTKICNEPGVKLVMSLLLYFETSNCQKYNIYRLACCTYYIFTFSQRICTVTTY